MPEEHETRIRAPHGPLLVQTLEKLMSQDRYKVGTKVECNGVLGIVVENFKLPNDICIQWYDGPHDSKGSSSSYDADWLDENAKIVN